MEIKAPSKLKKVGYCDDCGSLLIGQTKKSRKYQEKQINNEYVRVVCDKCLYSPEWKTITDKDLNEVIKVNKPILN